MSARLLGQKAAARYLGVGVDKLLTWTAEGRIPAVQDTRAGGPCYRWTEAALEAWQRELGRQAAERQAS